MDTAVPNTPPIPQIESPISPVSLASAPTQETPGISLSPSMTDNGAPTQEVAQQRGYKASVGLGSILGQNKDQLAQAISDGQERQIRTQAALDMDLANSRNKNAQIIALASQKGAPLEQDEVNRVLDPFAPNNRPVDPESILERAYATQYISSLNTADGYLQDTSWGDARLNMPKVVQNTMDNASELFSKNQWFQTQLENAQNAASKQSWVGFGVDQFKGFSQLYQEAKLRGNVPGVGYLDGLGLGANEQAQTNALFAMPMDQMVKTMGPVFQKLINDNPSLAAGYIQDLMGQSVSSERLKNVFSLAAPLDMYEGGKLGFSVLKRLGQYNEVQTAARQIIQAGAAKSASRQATAEATGDLTSASVAQATDNTMAAIQGTADPSKLTADAMTSNFRTDINTIGAATPDWDTRMSREQITRIQDNLVSATQDIPDTIAQMSKVQRIDLPTATEENIKYITGDIRDNYRGAKNSLLDVEYKGMNEFTNTHHYDLLVGTDKGELFSNPDTAANYARDNGFGQPVIESRQGSLESAEDAATKDKIRKAQDTRDLYGREFDKQVAIMRDKTATPEARTEAKERAKITKEAGIQKQDKVIADLQDRLANGVKPNKGINFVGPVQPEVRVQQKGVGFYLRIPKNLDETSPAIRDLMIRNLKSETVKSAESSATKEGTWFNALVGKYRSPEDTLSILENKQRKVAVYGEAVLQQLTKKLSKNIELLAKGVKPIDEVTGKPIPWVVNRPAAWFGKIGNKQVYNEWQRAVDYARDSMDPVTKLPGYFFKTAGELEQFYQTTFQRMPSYMETLAYFSKVELDELHRTLANISVYRNKARLGAEQHAVTYVDGATRTQSPFFDGVQRKELPGGDGNIMVMDSSTGKQGRVYTLEGNNIDSATRKKWIDQVRTGQLKVVEIYDPELRPFRDFGGVQNQRIQYVLSNTMESKPLSYDQVPRRGGGHFEYDADQYLKQASISTDLIGNRVQHHYEGDNTFMSLENSAMGRDMAGHLGNIQKMMRDGNLEDAKNYTQKHTSMEWKEMKGAFEAGRGPDGKVVPARFDLHEPFYVVPKNKTIFDLDKSLELRYSKRDEKGNLTSAFKDGTRHGSLARQFQVAYTKERDANGLITASNTGTKDNPYFAFTKAPLLDALPTMNRALNRAVKSSFMDDYKTMAVENWLREAENYLKADISEVRSSPFYHFQSANKAAFKSGAPDNIVRNLLSNQYKINQFIGVPNDFDAYIHSLTQHLVDSAYEKYGPESSRTLVQKAVTVVPLALLSRVHDPVTFIRSVTFNAKLGLFSIPQLLVQAQTHASIWALEPRHGSAGTFAMLLHQWGRFSENPEVLKSLDTYATKLGIGSNFRPGEFLEARRELAKTGFEHVGGEFATLDSAFNHAFVKNDFDGLMSAGQIFFHEGERSTRLTAWYTAFREFREENPTGLLTQRDRTDILAKADLLTNNMSRASSSALHGGVLSLTTQFLSYQLRVAELFLGKRIDNAARMRMVGMYSALYGVPAAFGLSGLPISSDIREAAINNGYVVGDNWINSTLMEGIPAMMVAMATGGGDYRKGTFYNIGDRYGAQGFTQLREALRSDAQWWKILGGAGVSTFVNTISNADGFTKAAMSFMRGDSGDQRFTLQIDDIMDAAKELSAVSNDYRTYLALTTGKWMAKNGSYITDVTPGQTLWMAATGLSPQAQDDVSSKSNITKGEVGAQKAALGAFITEFHRSVASGEANDQEGSAAHLRKAFAYLDAVGYPTDKKASAIAIASNGYESRISSADFSFYLKNQPTNRSDDRRATYKQQQALDDYRKQ